MTAQRLQKAPVGRSGTRKAIGAFASWGDLAVEITNALPGPHALEEVEWLCATLYARGRLAVLDVRGGTVAVGEKGLAPVVVPITAWAAIAARPSPRLALAATWSRVVGTLIRMGWTPQDDRFILAAVHAGRVERIADPRSSVGKWEPKLAEGEPLSDWILALFAADALERRDVYDTTLAVCERCGIVSLTGPEHDCP